MILRALLVLFLGLNAAHAQTEQDVLAPDETAQAQTARVASGEHDAFTRLVIELPAASDWTVGRLPLGYGFAASGKTQPGYDLSRVWDRIPRTRLQSLRVDPTTGALQLTLACNCHVFPFEYRPGMVVLDINDGPPPPGSSFETALSVGAEAATTRVDSTGTAETAFYDWLADRAEGAPATLAEVALDLPTGSVSLGPLRDELLAQISRGAAEGVVDMELPGKPVEHADGEWGELPWTTIHLGEGSGVEIRPGGGEETITSGTECPADADLDLASWGEDKAPADLLSEARSSLFGEFDRIEPKAVLRAVRIHLYLGFGAEARIYAEMLQPDPPDSLPFYVSMSHLIDAEPDPQTPFAAMLGCDGAAALWAALAKDTLPTGPEVNADAIVRAFLALPPHLRRDLAGPLADKFLARNDLEAARMIRNAVERTPDANPAEIALMDARAALQAGDLPSAQTHAETALQAGEDDADSLITLVDAHFREGTPLEPNVALTLRTLVREGDGQPDQPALQRALVLALALSGAVDEAFEAAVGNDFAAMDLWHVLPIRADDNAFLSHAVLAETDPLPAVDSATAMQIASRLVQLGFADAAVRWLGPATVNDPPERRQLAAEAELGRGNARAAADLLAGLNTPAAQSLTAQALIQLGAYSPAQEALLAAGSAEDAKRVQTWDRDWAKLGSEGDNSWSNAARMVPAPAPALETGPLGQSASLLEDSAAMRATVAALLAEVPGPQE